MILSIMILRYDTHKNDTQHNKTKHTLVLSTIILSTMILSTMILSTMILSIMILSILVLIMFGIFIITLPSIMRHTAEQFNYTVLLSAVTINVVMLNVMAPPNHT
jgi:hypothetical protein